MKLYDIPVEFAFIESALDKLLSENLGEVTPEVEEAEAKLAEMLKQGQNKVEAAICVIRNIEADANACAIEAARLAARSKSLSNNAARLKALVGVALDAAFEGKVKTAKFTAYMQDNNPSFAVLVSPDCDLLKLAETHPQFVKVEAEPKRKELADAVKAGLTIPDGLSVMENPRTRSLRIR